MSARLILQGGAKPLQIFAPGGTDEFTDLLFDADHAALRTLIAGVMSVTSKNIALGDWTAAITATVPYGKTFSVPPVGSGICNISGSYKITSNTRLDTGSGSIIGIGLTNTDINGFYFAGSTTLSATIAYLVFDHTWG